MGTNERVIVNEVVFFIVSVRVEIEEIGVLKLDLQRESGILLGSQMSEMEFQFLVRHEWRGPEHTLASLLDSIWGDIQTQHFVSDNVAEDNCVVSLFDERWQRNQTYKR